MRFRLLIILGVLFLSSSDLFAQNFEVTVVITNIKKAKGEISLGVFENSSLDFPKEDVVEGAVLKPVVPKVTHTFTLPKGTYAFVAYQDENLNGELDTNWLGFPSEPYAFSNNPMIPRYGAIEVEISSKCTIELEF